MKRCSLYNAFTLVEMLVVIAIIGILAVALMPQITKAREQGYATRCKANLRNLAQATLNYTVERDGYLPIAGSFEYAADNSYHEAKAWVNWIPKDLGNLPDWPSDESQVDKMDRPTWYGGKGVQAIKAGTLWEYIENTSAYICPKFKKKAICGQTNAVRSYVMNGYFYFEGSRGWHRNMLRLGCDASRLLLFSEMSPRETYLGKPNTSICIVHARSSGNGPPGPGDDSVLDPEGPSSVTNAVRPYESIGYIHPMSGEHYAHVVFADGHVEAFTLLKNSSGAIVTNLTRRLCIGDY